MIAFFIFLTKLLGKILKLLNIGSGTALPGLILERYFPSSFDHFANQLETTILITGTNGKTTTKAFIAEILDHAAIQHISNTSGSNMRRGLLSAFIQNSSLSGKLNSKFGLFEIEEATLPQVVEKLKPDILIVTNFFRDQLDAYGEVNKTREYVRAAIEASPDAELVLNADDPMVSTLGKNLPNQVRYFSIPEEFREKSLYEEHEAKEKTEVDNKAVINSANDIKLKEDLGTEFTLVKQKYNLKTPGIYYVYNALAAITTSQILEIDEKQVTEAFKIFKPAFGRGEEIEHKVAKNKSIRFKILLIKNPAGFTLTLELLEKLRGKNIKLMLILNDKIADGRDVSWIWDAEVEKLQVIRPNNVIVSGTRAQDMALRVKYSGIEKVQIVPEIKNTIELIGQQAENGETVYVLPTYTAMNEFRKILGKRF